MACENNRVALSRLARIGSIVSAIVCLIVGIHTIVTGLLLFWIGILTVIVGAIVLLLELPWLFACCCQCARQCQAKTSFFQRTLVRGILYLALPILTWLGPTLSILGGVLIFLCGVFYIAAHIAGDTGVNSLASADAVATSGAPPALPSTAGAPEAKAAAQV